MRRTTRVRKPVRRRRRRAALDRRRGGASRPRAALAEGGGAGGEPGAAAVARWRRGPLPPGEPAEMLAENLVEEFEMKEAEPWYDQRDLQQGEGAGGGRRAGGLAPGEAPGREPVTKLLLLAAHGCQGRGRGGGPLASRGPAAPALAAGYAGPAQSAAASRVRTASCAPGPGRRALPG